MSVYTSWWKATSAPKMNFKTVARTAFEAANQAFFKLKRQRNDSLAKRPITSTETRTTKERRTERQRQTELERLRGLRRTEHSVSSNFEILILKIIFLYHIHDILFLTECSRNKFYDHSLYFINSPSLNLRLLDYCVNKFQVSEEISLNQLTTLTSI